MRTTLNAISEMMEHIERTAKMMPKPVWMALDEDKEAAENALDALCDLYNHIVETKRKHERKREREIAMERMAEDVIEE